MKYALIGCGRVARNHINAARNNGLEIGALCDIVPEKAEVLAVETGLDYVKIYADYKTMLQAEKPDFTAIAASSGSHGEIALYCAQNGFNFLVEKPLAMSMEEANAVIFAAEKSGVTAGVCHQNRFNIAVQELKNAIDKGRFGKLSHGSISIRWHRDEDYYSSDAWRGKWASDGGTLMNQCVHGIDLLRWLMGEDVRAVYGFVRNRQHPYIEGEDVGVAVVDFESGAVATVEGTVNAVEDFEQTLTVFGEKGTARLGGINANSVDFWRFSEEWEDDEFTRKIHEAAPNIYGNGHISLYLDFIKSVEKKHQPYVDLYAGRNAVEMILSIYKSQKTGEKVLLPLHNFASVEMEDENIGGATSE